MSWATHYTEAATALDEAIAEQARLWLNERTMSEGYREAEQRTARARARWEARLIAFNAWSDWQRRSDAAPK